MQILDENLLSDCTVRRIGGRKCEMERCNTTVSAVAKIEQKLRSVPARYQECAKVPNIPIAAERA
eukprot:m.155143 g.155143  ORF g.155143 m.155143 type:complete len:65 (+) comp20804_c1_seq2:581-775(+)